MHTFKSIAERVEAIEDQLHVVSSKNAPGDLKLVAIELAKVARELADDHHKGCGMNWDYIDGKLDLAEARMRAIAAAQA